MHFVTFGLPKVECYGIVYCKTYMHGCYSLRLWFGNLYICPTITVL